MRISFLALAASFLLLFMTTNTRAACGDTSVEQGPPSLTNTCGSGSNLGQLTKTVSQKIYWLDGYDRTIPVSDTGQSSPPFVGSTDCLRCWPADLLPISLPA